jgi:hypothetical protein
LPKQVADTSPLVVSLQKTCQSQVAKPVPFDWVIAGKRKRGSVAAALSPPVFIQIYFLA